jgi:hypothetical protein
VSDLHFSSAITSSTPVSNIVHPGGFGAATPEGGIMHSDQRGNLSKKSFSRWASLSPTEKQDEFRQLIDSPYWHLLPEDVRSRIRSLVSN